MDSESSIVVGSDRVLEVKLLMKVTLILVLDMITEGDIDISVTHDHSTRKKIKVEVED